VQNFVIGRPGARDLYTPGLGSEPTEQMGREMFERSRGKEIGIVNAPRAGLLADICFHFRQ
jgi:hypothetical protein